MGHNFGKIWSEYDLNIIRKYYPIEAALGVMKRLSIKRTQSAVQHAAIRLGVRYIPLKKRPRDYKENCRKSALHQSYNITLEEYDCIFEQQNGVCAICGSVNKNGMRLSVDHNHKTNKVRGLLCINCNRKLGVLEDTGFVCAANLYLKATGG